MRPSPTVARLALTAALALAAMPGLLGPRSQGTGTPDGAATFRDVILASTRDRPSGAVARLDPERGSGAGLTPADVFQEERAQEIVGTELPTVAAPAPKAGFDWKPPKSTITGTASFYSAGYTAMRLPRGTIVVICGAAGCLERTITDYGPVASTGRIIDMYKPDFFRICGCPWYAGLTTVTVRIY
jgi:hypothetical protein